MVKNRRHLFTRKNQNMSANTELALLTIYKRVVPKINISRLTAELYFTQRNDGSQYATGIEITSDDERLYVMLSLHNKAHDEIVNNYRWEYMDCMTGAIAESALDYKAGDEEVIGFFRHTLATHEDVVKL